MAQTGARILAVDLSANALWLMAHRLPPGARVGRVHADINHLHVASHSFDRAFSTTPLDSRDQRMTMYRMISDALADDGRYIGCMEHDDLNRRLLGLPLMRRYSKNGILIEHLTDEGLHREVAPYFSKLCTWPIRPRVPFVTKLPRAAAFAVLRTVSVLPIIRNFGELLLVRAERPVRPPAEGQYRGGSNIVKGLYKSYLKAKGKLPFWGEESV
jgi:hypothetical protein